LAAHGRLGSARFGLLRKGVPALPIGSVLAIEFGRVDHRRIKQKPLGREAIERGRLNPTIAVSTEKTTVKPIDDQDDNVSRRTTIHWYIIPILHGRAAAAFAGSRKRIAGQNAIAGGPIGIPGMRRN
jgi:hypothetical protein